MNANEAELVTVVAHTEDGRIFQYIKNLIPVTEADRMKAAARLRAEETKAAALVKDTDALVGKAHAPSTSEQKPAPAARPVPQQRVAPRAPAVMAPAASDPVDAVVPARDAVVPARVAAAAKRRKQQDVQLAADVSQIKAALMEAKALISKKTVEAATYAGKEVGKAIMKKALDSIPADAPPGARLSVDLKQLEARLWSALQQLREQKYYPTVNTREFCVAFAKAGVVAVREAIAEFGFTPHYPAPQAGDASATQTSA
jgi:hypothetical protein